MPKSADIKGVAVVVIGVMAAGLIMFTFRDVGLINQARSGYDV
jgi:hypothetical protein